MILIGSKAIKHHYPEFPREPKDIDYIVNTNSNLKSGNGIEYLQNPIIYNRYKPFTNTIVSKDDLATIKASHLFWDIKWEKHMFDLQFLLKNDCEINEELFFKLYEYWNGFHSKNKRSDLKMSKEDFFTNKINYSQNQHDDLHKIINPNPVYEMCLLDGKEVELDENKFNSLSHENKLEFVREEVMVMAYERYSELGYKIAYSKMLKKFIISHAPLFSLIFILENFIELHKPKYNYIKQINNGLQKNQ